MIFTALEGERDERSADPQAYARHDAETPLHRAARFYSVVAPVLQAAVRPGPPLRLHYASLQHGDLRQELSARIETFRARQHTLRTEREAHCDDAIARIKSVTTKWEPRRAEHALVSAEGAQTPAPSDGVDTGWDRIWVGIERMIDGTHQAIDQRDRARRQDLP